MVSIDEGRTWSASAEHAGRHSVDRHMDIDLSRNPLDRFPPDEGGPPDTNPPPADHGLDAVAELLAKGVRGLECEVTTVRRFDERGSEWVRRQRIRGRRQPQRLVVAADKLGVPLGERPGLVEGDHRDLPQTLEHTAALDDDPATGGARDARDEGDRCRKDQRTGCRDDEHRECGSRASRDQPPGAGSRERHRQEDRRSPIREAHRRSPIGLGRLHEPHDLRVGGRARWAKRAQPHGIAGDARAASHLAPRGVSAREALARERRLVERRGAIEHDGVDRNHLTLLDENHITRGHEARGDIREQPIGTFAVRDGRCSLDEGAELPARPSEGSRIEVVTS